MIEKEVDADGVLHIEKLRNDLELSREELLISLFKYSYIAFEKGLKI